MDWNTLMPQILGPIGTLVLALTVITTAAVLYLTAGDYVQLETYQDSGSTDAGVLSRFAVVRLAGI